MKKLIYLIVVIVALSLIVAGCTTSVVPPAEQGDLDMRSNGGTIWYVNDDNSTCPGVGTEADPYCTIQAAIDAAADGDTISVAAGEYDEQVVIEEKSLTLQGAGVTTIIKPSQTTAEAFVFFERKDLNLLWTAAIIVVSEVDRDGVIVKDLKVDGELITAAVTGTSSLVGVLYRKAAGTIDNLTISNIETNNQDAAIYLSGFNQNVNVEVEVKNCLVDNYYKNGITANYGGLFANIHDNTVIGMGPIDYIAQNGIQLGFGAEGIIRGNVVSGNYYTGSEVTTACGILLYGSKPGINNIEVLQNKISDNQKPKAILPYLNLNNW